MLITKYVIICNDHDIVYDDHDIMTLSLLNAGMSTLKCFEIENANDEIF